LQLLSFVSFTSIALDRFFLRVVEVEGIQFLMNTQTQIVVLFKLQ